MRTTICGVKRSGFGTASQNIKIQFPFLNKQFDDISNCFYGTINIELEKDLIIINPDFTSNPINWAENNCEVFSFLKVKLRIVRVNKYIDSWIYLPYNSPHRKNLKMHEIICEKIEDIEVNESLEIEIEKEVKILDYLVRNIYIV